jgi:hypothetical protein
MLWMGMWGHNHTVTTTDDSPRFGRAGWYPRWCQCGNHATMIWLRLLNLLDWIPQQCHTSIRCLSTFTCSWLVYGGTLTQKPPQTTEVSPDLWELTDILCDAIVKTMPLCYAWGCRTYWTASHSYEYIYKVVEHLQILWIGILWGHTHTVTTTYISPDLWELLIPYPRLVCAFLGNSPGIPQEFRERAFEIWGIHRMVVPFSARTNIKRSTDGAGTF